MKAGVGVKSALDIARAARRVIEEKKGERVVVVDVRGMSSVADYYVIASGGSPPHLKAICDEVQRALRDQGERSYRRAGAPADGWLVLDYVDVVIHIFQDERRAYYALEELWEGAPRVS